MKEYSLSWRTIPSSGSVYYKGVLSVRAASFHAAIDEAEKIIRAKHKKFRDVPLKIIEEGPQS